MEDTFVVVETEAHAFDFLENGSMAVILIHGSQMNMKQNILSTIQM